MICLNTVDRIAQSLFTEQGYIDVKDLSFSQEIRRICQGNVCRNYGTSWACPPAVGSLSECEERVRKYSTMLLLSKKYTLLDSFDFEGMHDGLVDFKRTMDVFHEEIRDIASDCLLLSNEGCGRCPTCTYPQEPCRFPHKLHHSLEGYGFNVGGLAQDAGIRYNNGPNTVTFFGALLFRK